MNYIYLTQSFDCVWVVMSVMAMDQQKSTYSIKVLLFKVLIITNIHVIGVTIRHKQSG